MEGLKMNSEIKYLLPYKNFYKANLNSRSSLSDGRLSPEELKKIYKKKGYSVLAITDDAPVSQKELSDEDFLVLAGFSFGAVSEEAIPHKNARFTAISLNENPESIPSYDGEFDLDKISSYISECKEKGYYTTFSHPAKSNLVMPEYLKFSNADALEVINYSSLMEGYDEYSAVCYDDFVRRNHRLACSASDGNKNERELCDKRSDSFGAFTVINSDSLDYESISNSIKEGSYYATEGPEIKAIWIKGDTLNIRTSPVDKIVLYSGKRGSRFFFANGGVPLTAASFKINANEVCVRFIITDEDGNRAYTKSYYTDEIM